MGRSAKAIVFGFVVQAILTHGTVIGLGALFPGANSLDAALPRPGWLLLNLAYVIAYMALGGYVTALVAQRSKIKHALGLGALNLALGSLALLYYAGKPAFGYQLVLMSVALPAALLGGFLRSVQKGRTQA